MIVSFVPSCARPVSIRSRRHIFWRPRQDCAMAESKEKNVENLNVDLSSSGDRETEEWPRMEARFRIEGQAYGLKDLELLKYVQDL